MKTIIYIIFISIFLSSCSGSKFLNRKYTTGRFVEQTNALKHNTIISDVTTNYTSLNNKINLQKSISISETQTEKEIINTKVNSIVKKDSVFIKIRRGKDQKIIKPNNLGYNVITVINKKGVIVSQKTEPLKNIDPEVENNTDFKQIKKLSTMALALSIIPFLGVIIAIKYRRKLKIYKKSRPTEDLHKYSSRSTIAITISSIISSTLAAFIIVFGLIALLIVILSI